MSNPPFYKAINLCKINYVQSIESELTRPHVQGSGENIVNEFFHKSFHVPASQHAARFVGTYKFNLSLKAMKMFDFIELIVLLIIVDLILVTCLSATNKTHTLAC